MIDRDPDAFRRLGDDFAGQTVKGMGFDREVLVEAGIERAEAFAAVSSGDNSNIIAARVVREQYRVPNVVSRMYDPGRAEVFARLGIPMVATVRWATDQVLRRLLPSGSQPMWTDPSLQVTLLEVNTHRGWVGIPIAKIEQIAKIKIPFLLRLGRGVIPDSRAAFQDGDLVYAAVAVARVPDVESLLAAPPRIEG